MSDLWKDCLDRDMKGLTAKVTDLGAMECGLHHDHAYMPSITQRSNQPISSLSQSQPSQLNVRCMLH